RRARRAEDDEDRYWWKRERDCGGRPDGRDLGDPGTSWRGERGFSDVGIVLDRAGRSGFGSGKRWYPAVRSATRQLSDEPRHRPRAQLHDSACLVQEGTWH